MLRFTRFDACRSLCSSVRSKQSLSSLILPFPLSWLVDSAQTERSAGATPSLRCAILRRCDPSAHHALRTTLAACELRRRTLLSAFSSATITWNAYTTPRRYSSYICWLMVTLAQAGRLNRILAEKEQQEKAVIKGSKQSHH